jgi:catechol 2,3-dioxygenase-like lactoylglutathione lyase family enzyme
LDLVLEEISGTGTPALRARTTPRPRLVDPGAALLLLRVRSLGPVLAAAERAGTQRPARDSTNLVLVDPDGIFISVAELSEGSATDPVGTATNPATNAPAAGNVLSAEVAFTIAAPPTLVRFYRDVLGLAVRTGPFERTGSLEQLLDAPRALVAFAQIGAVRGSIGVLAFKGVPRHTYLFRPQDPGATAVTLEVSDLAAALRRVRSVGALVISAGGQPVASPNGEISILIRDPDGLLLQLQQATQLQPAQRQRAARPDPSPP